MAPTIAEQAAGLSDSRSIRAARPMTSKQGALFQRSAPGGPARSAPFRHFRRRRSAFEPVSRARPTARTTAVVAADTKAVARVQLPRRTKALVALSCPLPPTAHWLAPFEFITTRLVKESTARPRRRRRRFIHRSSVNRLLHSTHALVCPL
uniref:Uncharacterized protein n=1 Tax=Plectus sambesii TaxID=2011161 RepID=A0A914XIX2_9BILA